MSGEAAVVRVGDLERVGVGGGAHPMTGLGLVVGQVVSEVGVGMSGRCRGLIQS